MCVLILLGLSLGKVPNPFYGNRPKMGGYPSNPQTCFPFTDGFRKKAFGTFPNPPFGNKDLITDWLQHMAWVFPFIFRLVADDMGYSIGRVSVCIFFQENRL